MDARKLGLVAVWLVAAGCGGGTGNANTGAVSGANATAGGGSTAASGGATSAGGTGPDAWGPVEEVTPARRVSALDGVTDQWTRLSKLPDVAGRRKQMADYIVAQPEFRASGVEGTSIWGRFKDQRLVIIVDSPSWGATPGKQAPPRSRRTRMPHPKRRESVSRSACRNEAALRCRSETTGRCLRKAGP